MGKETGDSSVKVLVTGGCGFIGINIVRRHLRKGDFVVIIDNLSREGSENNRQWIKKQKNTELFVGPIESGLADLICRKHSDIEIVYHMAAQVAVTSSVKRPIHDFSSNAYGTLRILEAVRESCPKAFFIYASTNKVYGEMPDVGWHEGETRYSAIKEYNGFLDKNYCVSEDRPLDFHSPYGCSKGCADQYVRDYSRIYGLKTVVFRQSCIYGPGQTGHEDQGWLSWFCQKTLKKEKITFYGDGKQVRDVLYIDDLLDLYDLAYERRDEFSGQIFNIGGGPDNTLSLRELVSELEKLSGGKVEVNYSDWRPGDQKVYISNISKAVNYGWKPKIHPTEGIRLLYEDTKSWVR